MATNNADNFSNPIGVSTGGTGIASATAYAPLIGGTTSTGPMQSTTGLSSSGSVLISQGASSTPTFVSPNTNRLVVISSQSVSAVSSVSFTSGITATYSTYFILMSKIINSTTSSQIMTCTLSTNGGSSYVTSGYLSGWIDSSITSGGSFTNVTSTTGFVMGSAGGTTAGVKTTYGIYLFNVTSGANVMMSGQGQSGQGHYVLGGTCGTASVNAIKVTTASGTFTGLFTLFGVLE